MHNNSAASHLAANPSAADSSTAPHFCQVPFRVILTLQTNQGSLPYKPGNRNAQAASCASAKARCREALTRVALFTTAHLRGKSLLSLSEHKLANS